VNAFSLREQKMPSECTNNNKQNDHEDDTISHARPVGPCGGLAWLAQQDHHPRIKNREG
jgi:hypothetical protein